LRRNCNLKLVIEGKIVERIKGTERRGRRRKEMGRYGKLKHEALDLTLLRTCFGRGFGPVVRQQLDDGDNDAAAADDDDQRRRIKTGINNNAKR
jgi:hypothetical protein